MGRSIILCGGGRCVGPAAAVRDEPGTVHYLLRGRTVSMGRSIISWGEDGVSNLPLLSEMNWDGPLSPAWEDGVNGTVHYLLRGRTGVSNLPLLSEMNLGRSTISCGGRTV